MTEQYSYIQRKLFIGGEWVDPIDGELVPSINPATGAPWALTAFGGVKDIDRAVAAANEAMRGPWRTMPPSQRAGLIRKLGELLEANAPRLAELETRDNGRPLRETRANITAEAQWYYYFAGYADKMDGRVLEINPDVMAYTNRIPIGVVGAIVPWNAPTLVTTMKLAPALAAGCAMVIKVAEHTTVTTSNSPSSSKRRASRRAWSTSCRAMGRRRPPGREQAELHRRAPDRARNHARRGDKPQTCFVRMRWKVPPYYF